MTLLVLGRRGQLAQALLRRTWRNSPDEQVIALGSAEIDITSTQAIDIAIDATKPHLIVNAAAYTAVDRAEIEPEAAFALNAEVPGRLAAAAAARDIPFIHLSTDYVFDGTADRPYTETDPVNPLSVYGASKLAGERAVAEAGGRHAIVRTSWVFSADGHNFVKTMLRLAREREELRIVADQHGRPTAADDIADAIDLLRLHVTHGTVSGVVHFGGAPATCWHDFATAIFACAAPFGISAPRLIPISTAAYPTPARRPLQSTLDCRRYLDLPGAVLPNWHDSLRKVIADLIGTSQRT
jgi:dTDP-4-dehydrorhamnose reductase